MSDLLIGTQSRDLPTITAAGITPSTINTGGMLINADRGTEKVHELNSSDQIEPIFGRFRAANYGHYAMTGFFANLVGQPGTLYVRRAVPSDAVASSSSIDNASANATWTIKAGRRGLEDKGVWGDQLWHTIIADSRGGDTLNGALAGNETQIVVNSVSEFKIGDWIDIDDTTNDHQARITAIDENLNALTITPANPAANAIADTTAVNVVDRTIKVYKKDSDTGDVELVETLPNLTIAPESEEHYWLDYINDVDTGSGWIYAEEQTSGDEDTFLDFPVAVADDFANATQLTGGANGTALTTTQIAAAYSAFDESPIRYLTYTEAFSEAIWDDGEQYCRTRGDVVWVGAPTENQVFSALRTFANNRRRTRKIYAWTVGTWLEVDDPLGVGPLPVKNIPPVGHVMGYTIYMTSVRGVHKVPASTQQTLVGVRGLVGEIVSRTEIRDLANLGMNVISDKAGAFAIRSARTPSKKKEYVFINATIMSIFFKKSFEESFEELENEPNTVALLNRMQAAMQAFALTFYQSSSNAGSEGGFASFLKPGGAESSFADVVKIVVLDDLLNPAKDVNQGILKANFYFMPPAPAERILVGVGLIFAQ